MNLQTEHFIKPGASFFVDQAWSRPGPDGKAGGKGVMGAPGAMMGSWSMVSPSHMSPMVPHYQAAQSNFATWPGTYATQVMDPTFQVQQQQAAAAGLGFMRFNPY
eukprot:symbB.v1.2.013754.t1/scaffold976.1/size149240/7